MDILMTYWRNVWKQAVMDSERSFRNHSRDELRAFERSTKGRRTAPLSRIIDATPARRSARKAVN